MTVGLVVDNNAFNLSSLFKCVYFLFYSTVLTNENCIIKTEKRCLIIKM